MMFILKGHFSCSVRITQEASPAAGHPAPRLLSESNQETMGEVEGRGRFCSLSELIPVKLLEQFLSLGNTICRYYFYCCYFFSVYVMQFRLTRMPPFMLIRE